MVEAARYLFSVGLGEAVPVFADGVDENVADRDLVRFGTVPGGYGNRDAAEEICTLMRILHPIQDQVVSHSGAYLNAVIAFASKGTGCGSLPLFWR